MGTRTVILMRSEPKFRVVVIRTVNPRGSFSPSLRRKPLSAGSVMSIKFLRHSAQKSKSFWPSSCFCSSVRRCLDWVTSNFPSPCTVTRHTRRFVPPVINRRYECFWKTGWLPRNRKSYPNQVLESLPFLRQLANRRRRPGPWAVKR